MRSFDDLVEPLRAQDDDMCAGPTFSEKIQMAADEAHSSFISRNVRNLIEYLRDSVARPLLGMF